MRIPLSKLDVVARIVARVCTFRIRPSFESRRGAGCIVFFWVDRGRRIDNGNGFHLASNYLVFYRNFCPDTRSDSLNKFTNLE